MKSILVLHSGVELYGSDRSILQIIDVIKNKSNVHITVALHRQGKLGEYLKSLNVNVIYENYGVLSRHDVKKSPFKSFIKVLHGAVKLWKVVKSYDVVYVNTITVYSVYILFPFLLKKQKIINIREIATGMHRYVFSVLLRFTNAMLIFNSHATRNSYLYIRDQRTDVLYNYIDKSSLESDVTYESKSKIPQNILILGRIYPLKGQLLALNAIKELKDQNVSFCVRIVGGTAPGREHYLLQLTAYIEEHSLSDCVEIFEFQDDVSDFYKWADIVLVPSIFPESFGRTVIEGMALSKIVVASDHGGPSELIENGKTGLLFKPNSIQDLVNCLISVKNDTKKMQLISTQSRLYFEKTFAREQFEQHVMKILGLVDLEKN